MNRIRTTLMALAAALCLAPAAGAQSYCDNQTTGLLLSLPNYNQPFYQWGNCARNSLWTLNNSSASLSGSTVTASRFGPIYTPEIGGRDTGTPGIKVSSPIYTLSGGPYFTFRTSGSVEGAGGLGVTYGLTIGSGTVLNALTVVGSETVKGAGGLGVTYGLTAGSATVANGLTASSVTAAGAGGVLATYGVVAATGVFSGGITASSGNITGAAGLAVAYGVVAGTVTASSGSFTASGAANPYAVTSSTGIRVATGKLSFGSGGYIEFPDGTTQKTAPTAGSVATSSMTYGDTVSQTGNTATAYGSCIQGSSVTFSGTGAVLGFYGDFYKSTAGLTNLRWLVDGATIWGGADTMTVFIANDATKYISMQTPVSGLSAGAHTACLQYKQPAGGTFRAYTGNSESATFWSLGVP